jgi:hypothetical protein
MTELHDRLDRLAGPAAPVTSSQAGADLARGRRALRRRRTVTGAAAGVFAVAAAIAYGTASPPAGHQATVSAAPAPAVVATELVAYKGEQPKGYTIDKVPSGWEIQGNSRSSLTIAPVGAADRDPDAYVGKIAIMLQSKDQHGTPPGHALTVGGRPATLDDVMNLPGKILYVKQPDGIYLLVQIWDATGWTDAAIVEFAEGIHVLPAAEQGVG